MSALSWYLRIIHRLERNATSTSAQTRSQEIFAKVGQLGVARF